MSKKSTIDFNNSHYEIKTKQGILKFKNLCNTINMNDSRYVKCKHIDSENNEIFLGSILHENIELIALVSNTGTISDVYKGGE